MTLHRRHRRLLAVTAAATLGWSGLTVASTASAAPAPTPVATTQAQQADVRSQIVDLTNAERAKAGLKPLTLDTCLNDSAQKWSETMRAQADMHHSDLSTWMSSCKLSRAAENIAQGYPSAEAVVKGWMNSPGHRANILDPKLTKIGVGFSSTGNYATQQFGS